MSYGSLKVYYSIEHSLGKPIFNSMVHANGNDLQKIVFLKYMLWAKQLGCYIFYSNFSLCYGMGLKRGECNVTHY